MVRAGAGLTRIFLPTEAKVWHARLGATGYAGASAPRGRKMGEKTNAQGSDCVVGRGGLRFARRVQRNGRPGQQRGAQECDAADRADAAGRLAWSPLSCAVAQLVASLLIQFDALTARGPAAIRRASLFRGAGPV